MFNLPNLKWHILFFLIQTGVHTPASPNPGQWGACHCRHELSLSRAHPPPPPSPLVRGMKHLQLPFLSGGTPAESSHTVWLPGGIISIKELLRGGVTLQLSAWWATLRLALLKLEGRWPGLCWRWARVALAVALPGAPRRHAPEAGPQGQHPP